MNPSKIKLCLKSCNYPQIPDREIEVESKLVLCNNVHLPWETNYHNNRLWCIGNEFGVLGVLWADCEQDALDELVDQDLGGGLLIEEKDADEDSPRLGNAGEPANLDYAWMQEVDLTPEKNVRLLCMFAEARGEQADNLDN